MRSVTYRTENTVRVHYKDQSLNSVDYRETVRVCAENNANDNT
jgi:hypothetical protein